MFEGYQEETGRGKIASEVRIPFKKRGKLSHSANYKNVSTTKANLKKKTRLSYKHSIVEHQESRARVQP